MAVKKIITVLNPVLKEKSKPIKKFDQKLKQLGIDLIATAQAAHDPEGVGLSAVQINILKRVFVVKLNKHFEVFVNPRILWRSEKTFAQLPKEKKFLEGCLSIPGYFGFVNRPFSVKLQWQDLKGKFKTQKFENKESAYVQHEFDHLNGVLFTERILQQKGKLYQLQKDEKGRDELAEINL